MLLLSAGIIFIVTACNSSALITEVRPTSTEGIDAASSSEASGRMTTPLAEKNSAITTAHKPSETFKTTPTQNPTTAPTITPTKSPTQSSTPTITPTYSILRGTVLEQSNCRYGPGAAYLYKYGLYPGNNLEIIGRNELGTWILVQAIGGTNPCWLKALLMDIHGEVMSLAPASLPLPQSPYYGPLTGVSSRRDGNIVIISWDALNLRAGDDSLQFPYLIEAWVCRDGQLMFEPIGSWETIVSVQDEPGCSVPSHARVYGVEKHGYTNWVTVPWIQP